MSTSADSTVAGPLNAKPCGVPVSRPLRFTSSQARCPEFKTIEAPPRLVEMQTSVQRLDGGAADRQRVDADADRGRNRQLGRCRKCFEEALEHQERRSMRHVRSGERTIDIDLQRRDHAVEMRMLAERQLRAAIEIDRPFFRPVLEGEILQRRRSGRCPDPAAGVPGFAHHPLAARQRKRRPAAPPPACRRIAGRRDRR